MEAGIGPMLEDAEELLDGQPPDDVAGVGLTFEEVTVAEVGTEDQSAQPVGAPLGLNHVSILLLVVNSATHPGTVTVLGASLTTTVFVIITTKSKAVGPWQDFVTTASQ